MLSLKIMFGPSLAISTRQYYTYISAIIKNYEVKARNNGKFIAHGVWKK